MLLDHIKFRKKWYYHIESVKEIVVAKNICKMFWKDFIQNCGRRLYRGSYARHKGSEL